MSAGTCNVPACDTTTGTRIYLVGVRCPRHTPAAAAGHPEPGATADPSWLTRARRTLPGVRGGTDLDKERPGGYVSRQRAARIAETRDNIRANQKP